MNTQTPPSAKQLVADAQSLIGHVGPEQLTAELRDKALVLVDLRDQPERQQHGTIPGAVHIPRGMLEFCADPALPVHAAELDPSRQIVLFCASGNRSALAALTLQAMGFPRVAHLDGGFAGWRQAGGEIVPPAAIETAPWAAYLLGS